MSQDHFKQFVDRHKTEFDSYQEDFSQIWDEVEAHLDAKQVSYFPGWLKIAAAVALIAVSGWAIVNYQYQHSMPLEIYETEQHYYSIISAKMEEVQAHQHEVDVMIWQDLELLDKAYADLKKDLKEQADQEEVAQAMIQNQRAKLEILQSVLNEIESKANDKVESKDI